MIIKSEIIIKEEIGKVKKRGILDSFFFYILNMIKNAFKYQFKNIYIYKIFIISILCFYFIFIILNIKFVKNLNGRVFISFMYNNEAEMAYVHIWRLYDYIDKFIILVSNRTFSNNPKNFSFFPFEEKIRPYMNKIDIVNFNNICNRKEYPSVDLIWCFEKSQRDYAKIFIEEHYNPTENDLIIVVDIDEILTREGIKYIKENPPKYYYFVKGSLYFPYYYHKIQNWDVGCVIRYNKNMTTLTKYRSKKKTKILKYKSYPKKPLLTHCSYCFKDLEQYKNKIKSFSHQEFNKPPYITNNWIFRSHYCRVKINSPPGDDEPYEGWRQLIPDDPRLEYLIDPSFMYPLNLTTYTKEDLETICDRKYKRTPFE